MGAAKRAAPMRRVDWPVVFGGSWRSTFRQRSSRGVVSVLAAVDELVSLRDPETICRRAVELARDRLGLERVALFLLHGEGRLLGTFGTGAEGETTDERDIMFSLGDSHREAFSRSLAGVSRWLVLEGVPLLAQRAGRTAVLGHGWNALTPARSRTGIVGLFVNDAARSGSPLEETKQMQLAVFATIVGNLLELTRLDTSSLPWAPILPSARPHGDAPAAPIKVSRGVAMAMNRLSAEPALGTNALASAAHVPPRTLAKHFREEVGATVVDYRNRVRLERFLALVEENGGNLLQSALDAGFGSYAQFHRVFQRMLGVTPHEYVTGRRSGSKPPQSRRSPT